MLLYQVSFFFVTVDVDDLHSLFVVQINQSEYQDNVTVRFSDILYLMQYCMKLVKLAAYVNFFLQVFLQTDSTI